MTRIAYICADPGVPIGGMKGCSVHVQEVLRSLRGKGVEIEVFASSIGDDVPVDLRSTPMREIPTPRKGPRGDREKALLQSNERFERELARSGTFDAVYERYSLYGYAGMQFARRRGIPGLLEVNAPLIEEQAKHRGLVHLEEAKRVAKEVFTSASALLAVSDEVARYLQTSTAPTNRIHVVPNGVNTERLHPDCPPSDPAPADTVTVGFVGTLKPWHGVTRLIDAFATLHDKAPNTRLLIVGDGPERAAIEAQIAASGLTHATRMTGAVSPSAIPGLLTSMNIGVAPYPSLEQFYFSPLKVYEYMAAGLPVVVSAIGQLEQLVDHEGTGLLCRPGDSASLSHALFRACQDSQLRTRLGRAARAKVLQDHTWSRVAAEIVRLAESLSGDAPTQKAS